MRRTLNQLEEKILKRFIKKDDKTGKGTIVEVYVYDNVIYYHLICESQSIKSFILIYNLEQQSKKGGSGNECKKGIRFIS